MSQHVNASVTPSGTILTPEGWIGGHVEIADGRITAVRGRVLPHDAVPEPPFILPGFIDLHVHGGGGFDCMDGESSLRHMLAYHAAHGTVAMAPTTITAGVNAIRSALADIAGAKDRPGPGEPIVLGAHLEGPFINPNKLGAQPALTLPGDAELADGWAAQFPIAVATVAPEISGGLDVVRALARHRCRVQIGHSLANDAEAGAALACGCTGFTHLFNAMSGAHHREQGVAGYALAHAEYAELICDLFHVQETAVLAAHRAIPRLYAITDATSAAGLPDGEYRFAGRQVIKRAGRIVMEDGTTLAGSTITMADAFRNLVKIGIPITEASQMTATRQADYLGVPDLGRVEVDARACLVRLGAKLQVQAVWIDGEAIDAAT
jgi:N-acetylglucosamine-6-phosphate deacetylase